MSIERIELESVPPHFNGRDVYAMWDKINEIIDYINGNAGEINRPVILYAIENMKTGEIIFDKEGRAYQSVADASDRLEHLGYGYRIVEYKLKEC